MDKRGLIGKIILGLFLAIVIIASLTFYQAYDLFNSISTQQEEIEKEVAALSKGDCSKISSIETRVILLESKARSACKNPVIDTLSKKVEGSPYTCDDISSLKNEAERGLSEAKKSCDIRVLNNFTQEAIAGFVENITQNYSQYIDQYDISKSNYSEYIEQYNLSEI